MQAIRQILEPINRQITITLPKTFDESGAVEVIVLKSPQSPTNNISKFKGIWKNQNIDVEEISKEMRKGWTAKL